MKLTHRLALAIAAAVVALLVALALGAAALWATLDAEERTALATMLAPRTGLVALMVFVAAGAVGLVVRALFTRYVAAPARALERAQVQAAGVAPEVAGDCASVAAPVDVGTSVETRGFVRLVDALARERSQLRAEIDREVREASRGVERERSRLAALMAELTQSVVVCNLDGRILLYNGRARMQFRALSEAPAVAGGSELIGLGRSIYAVFDRRLVAHALESVRQRLQRGVPSPSAQFVTTTRAGQLLRVQLAPVRDPDGADEHAIGGFVLMLDNITRDFEQESLRDSLLHGLTEGSRAGLANVRAAVEMLELPDLEPAMRERFLGIVSDEVRAMSERVQRLAASASEGVATRWPLEDMFGADLMIAAARRIETAAGVRVDDPEVDAALWLRVDSFSLLQALAYLAHRLAEELGVRAVRLRLAPAGERVQLDLAWAGGAVSTETVMSWELDPMRFGADSTPLTVRDVVERHAGEFWFERDRARQQAFFRFLLPLARPREHLDAATFLRSESRPEYYDFDLFRPSETHRALDERRLDELAYTVFDTETTGLEPAQGDAIIQIGAVRIVNGRLLRQESFEQLVDPERPIPAQSIPIHGIRPEMVAGRPTISEVLPAFHAFAEDTVLVAHNAAFDMRFLALAEGSTGVRFEQPVLDTLLLSLVVHPNQQSHGLEAIAARLGVAVIGRHTALGDAMVTAEVFLRLLPLLREMGLHTLGQTRAAAQKTYLARLAY
jgi:DNA polymerase-3 subunit epsilon